MQLLIFYHVSAWFSFDQNAIQPRDSALATRKLNHLFSINCFKLVDYTHSCKIDNYYYNWFKYLLPTEHLTSRDQFNLIFYLMCFANTWSSFWIKVSHFIENDNSPYSCQPVNFSSTLLDISISMVQDAFVPATVDMGF